MINFGDNPANATEVHRRTRDMAAKDSGDHIVPWAERDPHLTAKLRALYKEHLDEWCGMQSEMYEEKWHVGRAMLDWFYEQNLISAEEFEALRIKHSRPKKPSYEMYRIIFIPFRASEKVAAISLAPQMGPKKGWTRSASSAAQLYTAEKELKCGDGQWLYAYGFENDLRYAEMQGELPRLKVGHTTGSYQERIRHQVRSTEVPDSPRVLRAYEVSNSGAVESEVHRRLEKEGCHYRRAGGSEWFTVEVSRLDSIVKDVVDYLGRLGQ